MNLPLFALQGVMDAIEELVDRHEISGEAQVRLSQLVTAAKLLTGLLAEQEHPTDPEP